MISSNSVFSVLNLFAWCCIVPFSLFFMALVIAFLISILGLQKSGKAQAGDGDGERPPECKQQ